MADHVLSACLPLDLVDDITRRLHNLRMEEVLYELRVRSMDLVKMLDILVHEEHLPPLSFGSHPMYVHALRSRFAPNLHVYVDEYGDGFSVAIFLDCDRCLFFYEKNRDRYKWFDEDEEDEVILVELFQETNCWNIMRYYNGSHNSDQRVMAIVQQSVIFLNDGFPHQVVMHLGCQEFKEGVQRLCSFCRGFKSAATHTLHQVPYFQQII